MTHSGTGLHWYVFSHGESIGGVLCHTLQHNKNTTEKQLSRTIRKSCKIHKSIILHHYFNQSKHWNTTITPFGGCWKHATVLSRTMQKNNSSRILEKQQKSIPNPHKSQIQDFWGEFLRRAHRRTSKRAWKTHSLLRCGYSGTIHSPPPWGHFRLIPHPCLAVSGLFPLWPFQACYPSPWGHSGNIPHPQGHSGNIPYFPDVRFNRMMWELVRKR